MDSLISSKIRKALQRNEMDFALALCKEGMNKYPELSYYSFMFQRIMLLRELQNKSRNNKYQESSSFEEEVIACRVDTRFDKKSRQEARNLSFNRQDSQSQESINYIIITPFWQGDIDSVEMQASWLCKLGHSFKNHVYLYRQTDNHPKPSFLPNLIEFDVSKIYPNYANLPHPAGPNICFFQAYQIALEHNLDYFFWLEPDCIPTSKDWIEPFLEAAKLYPEEPIIGIVGGQGWSDIWKNHFAGNSLYNVNLLSDLNWSDYLEEALDKSFDIWLSKSLGFIDFQDLEIDSNMLSDTKDTLIWGDRRVSYKVNKIPKKILTCGYDHWRPQKFQSLEKTFEQCLSQKFKIYHSIKDNRIYKKLWHTEKTRFSIIVFNYNYSQFLPQCLDSLLKQDYPGEYMQVIVVDDGSSDNSLAICTQYKFLFEEKEIEYEIISLSHGENCPNLNQQRCLIEASKLVKGAFVCFLDSDDEFVPYKLSYVNKHLNSDVVLFQHAARKVDSNGNELGDLTNFASSPKISLELYIKEDRFSFYQPTSFLVFNKLYLMHCIESYLEWDKFTNTWLDVRCTRLAPLYGQVVSSYECLGLYRLHQSNDSSSKENLDHRLQEHTYWTQEKISSLSKYNNSKSLLGVGFAMIRELQESSPNSLTIQDPSYAAKLSDLHNILNPLTPSNINSPILNLLIKQQCIYLKSAKIFSEDFYKLPIITDAKSLLSNAFNNIVNIKSSSSSISQFNIDILIINVPDFYFLMRLKALEDFLEKTIFLIDTTCFLKIIEVASLSEINCLIDKNKSVFFSEFDNLDALVSYITDKCSFFKEI